MNVFVFFFSLLKPQLQYVRNSKQTRFIHKPQNDHYFYCCPGNFSARFTTLARWASKVSVRRVESTSGNTSPAKASVPLSTQVWLRGMPVFGRAAPRLSCPLGFDRRPRHQHALCFIPRQTFPKLRKEVSRVVICVFLIFLVQPCQAFTKEILT